MNKNDEEIEPFEGEKVPVGMAGGFAYAMSLVLATILFAAVFGWIAGGLL